MSYGTTKAQATAAAKAAVRKMKVGGKWKISVWENLGWCWSISNGFFTVFQGCGSPEYHCLPIPGYAQCVPTVNWARDPNNAVLKVARYVREALHYFCSTYEPALASVGLKMKGGPYDNVPVRKKKF